MRGMKPVLGAEAGASRLLAENGPVWFVDRVAPNLGGLVIYLDAGLLDFTFVDDCELDRKLSEHQMPHDFRLYWGWHDWPFWRRRLLISLPIVMRGMWSQAHP